MDWKIGDWVIFDLSIGQIKDIRENGGQSFSDGSFETSGMLADRFRLLTLRNKAIIEYFDWYYNELRKIDGEAGFNYPDIFQYFAQLARDGMDGDDELLKERQSQAQDFVSRAKNHQSKIQGISLFRKSLRRGY